MSIEDTLSTARGCFEAGLEFSDADFELHKERIAKGVTQDPEQSYWAGRNWRDSKFNSVVKVIAKGVAQDAEWSYQAGKGWDDEQFELAAQTISQGTAKSAEWSYQAGREWKDERFNPFAEVIVQGVAKNSEWSYEAGNNWKNERFLPVAKRIVQGVAQDPESCYQAGLDWYDERFEPNWWTLVQGLNDEHKEKAKEEWPGIRPFTLLFAQNTPNTYFQYDKKEREVWSNLAHNCDTKLLINLQPVEFRTLARAYELVKNKIEDHATSFYNGLNQVLENRTVIEWSQHIIDHFEEKAIGGDTYRGVAV
jgi:hypothetical protein